MKRKKQKIMQIIIYVLIICSVVGFSTSLIYTLVNGNNVQSIDVVQPIDSNLLDQTTTDSVVKIPN